MIFYRKINNDHGMALILVMFMLGILMLAALSLSRVSITSMKISRSGSDFRKMFQQGMGINSVANYWVLNSPVKTSGLRNNEYISLLNTNLAKSDQFSNTQYSFSIKKSNMSKKSEQDIGSLIYAKEKFMPGSQINTGGGRGTQNFKRACYQVYTRAETNGKKLLFRNWLEKSEL